MNQTHPTGPPLLGAQGRIEALKSDLELDAETLAELRELSISQQIASLVMMSKMGIFDKKGYLLH